MLRFIVPAFIIRAGIVFVFSHNSGYFKFMSKKIHKILIPYFIYFVVYAILFNLMGIQKFDIILLFKQFFIGNLSAQFYFVVIIMQFYLLKPLWDKLLKNNFVIIILISAVVSVLCSRLSWINVFVNFSSFFKYADNLFLPYLIYFVLGLYLGKNYEVLNKVFSRNNFLIAFLFLVFYNILAFVPRFESLYDVGILQIAINILSFFALFILCKYILQKKWYLKLFEKMHKASFDVFLSHLIFLNIANYFFSNMGIISLSTITLLDLAICFTLPFGWFYLREWFKCIRLRAK